MNEGNAAPEATGIRKTLAAGCAARRAVPRAKRAAEDARDAAGKFLN